MNHTKSIVNGSRVNRHNLTVCKRHIFGVRVIHEIGLFISTIFSVVCLSR